MSRNNKILEKQFKDIQNILDQDEDFKKNTQIKLQTIHKISSNFDYSVNSQLQGEIQEYKNQYKDMVIQIESESDIIFNTEYKIGSKISKIENLKSVFYENKNTLFQDILGKQQTTGDLEHKNGEIWIILVWASWCNLSHKILEQMQRIKQEGCEQQITLKQQSQQSQMTNSRVENKILPDNINDNNIDNFYNKDLKKQKEEAEKTLWETQMSIANSYFYKNKVKMIGISVDNHRNQIVNSVNKIFSEEIQQNKCQIDFYGIQNGWDRNHAAMKIFGVKFVPKLIVINQQGELIFNDHPQTVDFDSYIPNLIKNVKDNVPQMKKIDKKIEQEQNNVQRDIQRQWNRQQSMIRSSKQFSSKGLSDIERILSPKSYGQTNSVFSNSKEPFDIQTEQNIGNSVIEEEEYIHSENNENSNIYEQNDQENKNNNQKQQQEFERSEDSKNQIINEQNQESINNQQENQEDKQENQEEKQENQEEKQENYEEKQENQEKKQENQGEKQENQEGKQENQEEKQENQGEKQENQEENQEEKQENQESKKENQESKQENQEDKQENQENKQENLEEKQEVKQENQEEKQEIKQENQEDKQENQEDKQENQEDKQENQEDKQENQENKQENLEENLEGKQENQEGKYENQEENQEDKQENQEDKQENQEEKQENQEEKYENQEEKQENQELKLENQENKQEQQTKQENESKIEQQEFDKYNEQIVDVKNQPIKNDNEKQKNSYIGYRSLENNSQNKINQKNKQVLLKQKQDKVSNKQYLNNSKKNQQINKEQQQNNTILNTSFIKQDQNFDKDTVIQFFKLDLLTSALKNRENISGGNIEFFLNVEKRYQNGVQQDLIRKILVKIICDKANQYQFNKFLEDFVYPKYNKEEYFIVKKYIIDKKVWFRKHLKKICKLYKNHNIQLQIFKSCQLGINKSSRKFQIKNIRKAIQHTPFDLEKFGRQGQQIKFEIDKGLKQYYDNNQKMKIQSNLWEIYDQEDQQMNIFENSQQQQQSIQSQNILIQDNNNNEEQQEEKYTIQEAEMVEECFEDLLKGGLKCSLKGKKFKTIENLFLCSDNNTKVDFSQKVKISHHTNQISIICVYAAWSQLCLNSLWELEQNLENFNNNNKQDKKNVRINCVAIDVESAESEKAGYKNKFFTDNKFEQIQFLISSNKNEGFLKFNEIKLYNIKRVPFFIIVEQDGSVYFSDNVPNIQFLQNKIERLINIQKQERKSLIGKEIPKEFNQDFSSSYMKMKEILQKIEQNIGEYDFFRTMGYCPNFSLENTKIQIVDIFYNKLQNMCKLPILKYDIYDVDQEFLQNFIEDIKKSCSDIEIQKNVIKTMEIPFQDECFQCKKQFTKSMARYFSYEQKKSFCTSCACCETQYYISKILQNSTYQNNNNSKIKIMYNDSSINQNEMNDVKMTSNQSLLLSDQSLKLQDLNKRERYNIKENLVYINIIGKYNLLQIIPEYFFKQNQEQNFSKNMKFIKPSSQVNRYYICSCRGIDCYKKDILETHVYICLNCSQGPENCKKYIYCEQCFEAGTNRKNPKHKYVLPNYVLNGHRQEHLMLRVKLDKNNQNYLLLQ